MLCEMSGRQAELYKEELARAQHLVLSSSGFDMVNRRRFAILQALTRLRQICCHPGLIDKTAESEESAKLTATLDLIQELHAEGHKVLLFSQFVTMLKIIRTKLEELNLPFHWLTGASTDRAGIVHVGLGKKSFTAEQLTENYAAVLDEIMRAKPASAKGKYIKSISIAQTMGPGIDIDPQ